MRRIQSVTRGVWLVLRISVWLVWLVMRSVWPRWEEVASHRLISCWNPEPLVVATFPSLRTQVRAAEVETWLGDIKDAFICKAQESTGLIPPKKSLLLLYKINSVSLKLSSFVAWICKIEIATHATHCGWSWIGIATSVSIHPTRRVLWELTWEYAKRQLMRHGVEIKVNTE